MFTDSDGKQFGHWYIDVSDMGIFFMRNPSCIFADNEKIKFKSAKKKERSLTTRVVDDIEGIVNTEEDDEEDFDFEEDEGIIDYEDDEDGAVELFNIGKRERSLAPLSFYGERMGIKKNKGNGDSQDNVSEWAEKNEQDKASNPFEDGDFLKSNFDEDIDYDIQNSYDFSFAEWDDMNDQDKVSEWVETNEEDKASKTVEEDEVQYLYTSPIPIEFENDVTFLYTVPGAVPSHN